MMRSDREILRDIERKIDDLKPSVSKSASVKGYVPSVDEIKAFTPVQAKGFIVGNLTLKLNKLGMPAEQAGEMANLILYKAGT